LDAYTLKTIIHEQQSMLSICERSGLREVPSEEISKQIESLKSDRAFLQAVIGLKLISATSRDQLLQESRLVSTDCANGNRAPVIDQAERQIANRIVELADRMADRVPAQEIERKLESGFTHSPAIR
jgi:hypothetical protein